MGGQEKPRAIIHLDMDAFYPAVEALDNPALKGRAVIVGGGTKRGVVASASYEARKWGVHSAQPVAKAVRLCPDAVLLPVRMHRYREISAQVFEIFYRFTPVVEPVSIDEAFLDVSESRRLYGPPREMAQQIKDQVWREIGLTVSAGVAPCKFVAKIASDMKKPDGLVVVPSDGVEAFLEFLSINRLWGVGRATQHALRRLGVNTIGELRRVPQEALKRLFGRHGEAMHRLSMGIDDSPVVARSEAKSIGHEETFVKDIMDKGEARKALLSLAGQVASRMRGKGLKGRTITLKVKYGDFVSITRSVTVAKGTDDGGEIYALCCGLLEKTEIPGRPARLLGVSLSQLTLSGKGAQLSLFREGREVDKKRRLNTALDSIWERFGENSIRPGALFEKC